MEAILLILEALQVCFLWVHDWIPLGRLNDVAAVRSQDTLGRLVTVTVVQSLPWTIGLYFSVRYFGRTYPDWLSSWLWISYVVLLFGQIRAWWIPYLLTPDPKRAARYRIMFGNTRSLGKPLPNWLSVEQRSVTFTPEQLSAINPKLREIVERQTPQTVSFYKYVSEVR